LLLFVLVEIACWNSCYAAVMMSNCPAVQTWPLPWKHIICVECCWLLFVIWASCLCCICGFHVVV
jgi:hypothetical protein